MAVVALRSLRVTADFDSAAYKRGMAEKVAADAAGAASSKAVGIALAQTDAAMDKATGRVSALSRSLIDGYGTTAKFESTIRSIGRAVDQGMGLDRAAILIEAANRKFGLTANTAALARQGYASIVPVVAEVNARYVEQARVADQAAAALRRLGDARDASARMVGGMSQVGAPRYTDLAASERLIAGMSGAMDHFGVSTRQASYLTKQLSFQLFDIAQGIPLLLASPLYGTMNLVTQAGQIKQLYIGQGGLKQAFIDTKNAAVGLGASLLTGLSNPLGQVAIVAGVAAVAVGALFLRERSQAQAAEQALKEHIDLIGRIAGAYKEAGGAVNQYGTESARVLESIDRSRRQTVQDQLNRTAIGISSGSELLTSLGAPGAEGALLRLNSGAVSGAANWRKFGEEIVKALDNPRLNSAGRTTLETLRDMAAEQIQIQTALERSQSDYLGDERGAMRRARGLDQGEVARMRHQEELEKAKKAMLDAIAQDERRTMRRDQALSEGEIARMRYEQAKKAAIEADAQDERQRMRRDRALDQGEVSRLQHQQEISTQAATASYEAQLLSIRAISREEQIAAAMAQARADALQDGVVSAQELLAIQRAGNLAAAQFDMRQQTELLQKAQREQAELLEQAQRRFNDELDQTIAKMDAVRGSTQDTISTLLGGLESGKFSDSVVSAMETIKGRLNDALAGTFTNALMGKQGQFGGGLLGDFIGNMAGGIPRGSSPVTPLYVSVVSSLGGGIPIPGGGVGNIIGDIFGGRSKGGGGVLDLIARAEGTGGNYNETLARGLLTGGKRNLTGMSLDQIDALQSSMLQNPANRWNSSALGRYQITQRTLRGLRGEMGLDGSEMYDPQMQDMLAGRLLNRRGPNIGGLRSEWAGLSEGDASQIATMMKASGEKITGSLDQLGTGMQQSVSSFSPQFGGSLQKLLSLFASSGLSSAAFSLGAGGGAGLFAAGGYIRGPGSGTSDSILARISNGEFVVNAAATSRHRSMLETINSAPRFYTGGMVGGGGYGSKTEVHVHNNNGSKVNVKHSQDGRGQPRVEISVDEQVAGALRSDRSARTMATQYGAGRRLERT